MAAEDGDVNNTMDALFAANGIIKGASEVFLDEKVKAGKQTLLQTCISSHQS